VTPGARRAWRVVQVALTLVFIGFAGWFLWRQWSTVSEQGFEFEFDALWLLLASFVVLSTYIVLVETWRRVLASLGGHVEFGPAARIWFISNLGKYVPGKIWQVSTMTLMLAERGVSVATGGASAVVITIANVATGFAVVLFTSTATVRSIAGSTGAVIAATVGLLVSLVAAPLIARQWNRFAARLGREQLAVTIPLKAIWIALVGCSVSWLLYGVGFQFFVRSLIGPSNAPMSAFITANAASYLVGYLTLISPGGIGIRELVLASILVPLRIATAPQAAVITILSRVWLTLLEIVPSVIALARGGGPPSRGSIARQADSVTAQK
jgi:uncharacterized membrane protein YbhN (UPF0104 family)